MPTPTLITDLDPVVANNFPAGSNAPSVLDDVQRAHAAFIRQLLNATQTQLYTAFTTAGTTTAYTLTPSPAITALAANQRFPVKFNATNTSTTPTLAISGLTAKSIKVYDSAGAKADPAIGAFAANMLVDLWYDGTDYVAPWVIKTLSLAQGGTNNTTGPVLRSYLAGYGLSTAGSSATMSIAAGTATDSTNVTSIIGAAIAKTTSAWVVGTATGGKSLAAAIANNTWYHFYTIRRPDTGVVDVCFSTNAAGLLAADFVAGGGAVPDAYTQFRRIGSGKTNGSAQWVGFTQTGDYFRLKASVLDVNATNPGTAMVTATLASVPPGVKVKALISSMLNNSSSVNPSYYVHDLDANDESPAIYGIGTNPTVPGATGFSVNGGAVTIGTQLEVMTNTSAQIGYRIGNSGASDVFAVATLGWTDTRGRDN